MSEESPKENKKAKRSASRRQIEQPAELPPKDTQGSADQATSSEADGQTRETADPQQSAPGSGGPSAPPDAAQPHRSPQFSPPQFSGYPKMALQVAAFLVLAFIAFWIVDKVVIYRLSSGYIDQIAQTYDMNRHLATALTIVAFAFLAIVARFVFSFSRRRRYAAWAVLAVALVGHSMVLWRITRDQPFDPSGQAAKCYVMTRTAILYRERVGFDPVSGLECRPITPDIAERIREYEGGRRPTAVVAGQPTFFDPRTGSPVIWFARSQSGQIELFDLMGYHPRTGEELQPVNREVVGQWHRQVDEMRAVRERRVPQRVDDPEKFGFFDALTGAPRLWYWKGDTGEYQFFDSDGFHSQTGTKLTPVTADVVTQWRKDLEEKRRRRTELEQQRQREEQARQFAIQQQRAREEQEKNERAERDRQAALQLQQQERERTERVERERQQQEAQARAEAERRERAGIDCDLLAANPTDQRRPSSVPGVPYGTLAANTAAAIAACRIAVQTYPAELRFQYQLARAQQINAPRDAMVAFRRLTDAGYPAAFDNLGSLEVRLNRNYVEAARLFRRGVRLNDADSMVSLAELIERNFAQPQSASETKWQLLGRAAQLGHSGASLAMQQAQAEAAQRQREGESAREALEMFRGIIQSMPSR